MMRLVWAAIWLIAGVGSLAGQAPGSRAGQPAARDAAPGLPSPDRQAQVFLPGLVSSGAQEYGLTVDQGWTELYFTRLAGESSVIMTSRRRGDLWSEPVAASFSGVENDSHPWLSGSGRSLFFMSLRALPGAAESANMWVVQKSPGGWGRARSPGTPLTLQVMHAPSVANDGTVYVTGIQRFRRDGDGYQPGERLTPNLSGSHPAISADQSFLVFSARRSGGWGGKDLYVVFSKGDGSWTDPVNLGGEVNSPSGESSPTISSDGRFLFYSRRDEIWWISTEVIEEVRPPARETSSSHRPRRVQTTIAPHPTDSLLLKLNSEGMDAVPL
jgi:WD40 repeat protein